MGQYYRIANLDKRETLDPFKFGSALKLTESCYVGNDYVDAITYLLANDWHGDRVLLCGDYAWDEEVGFSAAGRLRELAESDPFEAAGEFLDRSGDFASVRGNEVYREAVSYTHLDVYKRQRRHPHVRRGERGRHARRRHGHSRGAG